MAASTCSLSADIPCPDWQENCVVIIVAIVFHIPCIICTRRERTAEILSDERVQAAQAAGRGGRVRSETESAAASSVTVVGDNRAEVSAPGPAGNGARPQVHPDMYLDPPES